MPMSIKELDRTYRRAYRRLAIGISIVYVVALLAGLAILVGNSRIAGWTSQGVHAEFVGSDAPSTPQSMRLAQPAKPIRAVKPD
jgi:hypothetical protein